MNGVPQTKRRQTNKRPHAPSASRAPTSAPAILSTPFGDLSDEALVDTFLRAENQLTCLKGALETLWLFVDDCLQKKPVPTFGVLLTKLRKLIQHAEQSQDQVAAFLPERARAAYLVLIGRANGDKIFLNYLKGYVAPLTSLLNAMEPQHSNKPSSAFYPLLVLLTDSASHGIYDWAPMLDAHGVDWSITDASGNTLLILSIVMQSQAAVKALLDMGVDINAQNDRGQTALHMAAQAQQRSLIYTLIIAKAKLNVDLCDNQGVTPLMLSAGLDDTDAIYALVNAKANVNLVDMHGVSALMRAAKAGHLRATQMLVEAKADVHMCSTNGACALYLALSAGHTSIVQYLLSKHAGANANARRGDDRLTFLMHAAPLGNSEIVSALLYAKADVHLRDDYGRTALLIAATEGHVKVVKQLLAAGTDPNTAEHNHTSALMHACQHGHADVVDVLLDAGVHLEAGDGNGSTALLIATCTHQTKIVRRLMAARANVNTRNRLGHDVLTAAADREYADIVELMLQAKVDVNRPDNQGATALLSCAVTGNVPIMRMLLDAKAQVNLSSSPVAPLTQAAAKGHLHVLSMLLEAGAEVNSVDTYGRTALSCGVEHQQVEVVRTLIALRASVNAPTANTVPPLLFAASAGNTTLVKMLVEAGARVDTARGEWLESAFRRLSLADNTVAAVLLTQAGADLNCVAGGRSILDEFTRMRKPLMASAVKGALNNRFRVAVRDKVPAHVLRSLLSQRANVDCADKHANTPLLLALQGGDEVTAALLLDAKAKTEVCNARGLSPLMLAAMDVDGRRGTVLDRLVKAKADVNGQNKAGHTALMVAVYHGRQAVAEKLLASKAKVNLGDKRGNTALMLAARSGASGMVKLLLSAKADAKASDKKGTSALILAARSASVECMRALLHAGADAKLSLSAKQGVRDAALGDGMRTLLRTRGFAPV